MGETIRQSASTISELTGAQAVQAMLTLILTITLMILVILGRDVPEYMTYAWFALLGLYFEVPSKGKMIRQVIDK